jgi:hypothetical protein
MSAQTTTTSPAIAGSVSPPPRGFKDLDCPCCGSQGGVSVQLEDLSQFHCGECDNDFDADAVRDFIARWTRVLSWIELAPVLPAE